MAAVSEDLLPKANNPLQQWRRWSLSYFVSYYYAPFLQQTPIKVSAVTAHRLLYFLWLMNGRPKYFKRHGACAGGRAFESHAPAFSLRWRLP